MTWSARQIDIIRHGIRDRLTRRPASNIRGIHRIDVRVEERLQYEAESRNEPGLRMIIDEPADRGGSGRGPGPISHFLTGAATCLLNQFIRVSVSEGYDVTFTGAELRAEFSRGRGGRFEYISSTIEARGTLPRGGAEELLSQAEALCYIHNTLKAAVRMSTVLKLNGDVVAAHEGQSSSDVPELSANS